MPALPPLGVPAAQPQLDGDEAPHLSVSQQADNFLHIISFGTARVTVCDMIRRGNVDSTISRNDLACELDKLHVLSLKPAVLELEPESAFGIGEFKSWAMNALARPGQMAHCDDGTLFAFIASKLMAQDVTMAGKTAIDDEFATFLQRSNSVRKSLASARAQSGGTPRPAPGVPPPRVVPPVGANPICPKCQGPHFLRACNAPYAVHKDGSRNLNWKPRREHPQDREQGRPAPYGGRPALLAP